MLYRVISFWASIALLPWAVAAPASREPVNLDLRKAEIREYVDSGKYQEDIAAVAAEAKTWVESRAAKRAAGERLAVVFDLDETLLLNWPYINSIGLGYDPAGWDAWVKQGEAAPIEPVREVYRAARKLGLDVIFITGRRERDRAGTEKNLKAIGCAEYAALYFKPDASRERTGTFKTATRAKLEAEGRVIIANLGDQMSDLEGGHAEKIFKLPNPVYIAQ